MIKQLKLQNFKAWSELNIEFGQVTGLFGANSSGKSSLIQFLLMLKQTKNCTDRNMVLDLGSIGQIVNLGTYSDIVFQHKESSSINWQLNWLTKSPIKINDPSQSRKTILFNSCYAHNLCTGGSKNVSAF